MVLNGWKCSLICLSVGKYNPVGVTNSTLSFYLLSFFVRLLFLRVRNSRNSRDSLETLNERRAANKNPSICIQFESRIQAKFGPFAVTAIMTGFRLPDFLIKQFGCRRRNHWRCVVKTRLKCRPNVKYLYERFVSIACIWKRRQASIRLRSTATSIATAATTATGQYEPFWWPLCGANRRRIFARRRMVAQSSTVKIV